MNPLASKNSFETDLQRHFSDLRRLARRLCRDIPTSEDLFQDTMLLAIRFRQGYCDGTNMRAWLCRIMKNRHISILRRRSLEMHILEAEGLHSLRQWSIGEMGLRSTEAGGDVHSDVGFDDSLTAAMNDLKPEYREVVLLCDVDDNSYAEAATKLDCPIGTVMSRLHRGRRALRGMLVSREQLDRAA